MSRKVINFISGGGSNSTDFFQTINFTLSAEEYGVLVDGETLVLDEENTLSRIGINFSLLDKNLLFLLNLNLVNEGSSVFSSAIGSLTVVESLSGSNLKLLTFSDIINNTTLWFQFNPDGTCEISKGD